MFNASSSLRVRYLTVRVLCLILLGGFTLVTFISSGEAAASNPSLKVRVSQPKLTKAIRGGQVVTISARSRRGATCAHRVRAGKRSVAMPKAKTDKRGRITWQWMIVSTSPSGKWVFKVRCTKHKSTGSDSVQALIITSDPKANGPIGDPKSVRVPRGQPAGKGSLSCGPFTSAVTQCTCWAYSKRRDVYDLAVRKGVPAGGQRAPFGRDFWVWDGGQWLVNAKRAGIPTGSRPVAGALAVWGTPNSASWGHVAYVEQVQSLTQVRISECNYDNRGSCRTTWQNPQRSGFQGYVYGGPAGNGPGTNPTPDTSTKHHFSYFVGADGNLRVSHWTGATWQHDNLYQGVRSGTSPSAYAAANGQHHAFFVGNDGRLRLSLWTGSSWRTDDLGQTVAAGTSPSAYQAPNGQHFVYFVGTDGTLRVSHWTGARWQHDNLFQGVLNGTSPSAYVAPDGKHHVVFVGNDHGLRMSLWTGSLWRTDDLGQNAAGGSTPSTYLTSGRHFVYFTGMDGNLRVSHFTGTGWQHDNLFQGIRSGTSPSAYATSKGQHHVYFAGNDGGLRVSLWTGSGWRTDNLSQGLLANTSPSAYVTTSDQHHVYFTGNDGSLRLSLWTGSAWRTDDLAQASASGSSPDTYPR